MEKGVHKIFFLKNQKIFDLLSEEEFNILDRIMDQFSFSPGEFVVREGDTSKDLFFLVAGKLEVLKKSPTGQFFKISAIQEGDLFGEMAFIDGRPRSSSIKALEPSIVYQLSLEKLSTDNPISQRLYDKVYEKIVGACFKRIRTTNVDYLKILKEQIQNLEHQNLYGIFFVFVVAVVSIYSLLIAFLPLSSIYNNPLALFFISSILVIPTYIFAKVYNQPLNTLGLTWKNTLPTLWQTALILFSGTTLAWGFVALSNSDWNTFLVTYFDVLDDSFSIALPAFLFYIFSLEFTFRGVIQTSLQEFLNDKKGLITILCTAAFLFAMNLHLTLPVAVIKFYFDLLLGFMYLKQKNLIGVVTLHYLVVVLTAFYY